MIHSGVFLSVKPSLIQLVRNHLPLDNRDVRLLEITFFDIVVLLTFVAFVTLSASQQWDHSVCETYDEQDLGPKQIKFNSHILWLLK